MNININTYAASICSTYQVDSQGHTPCQAGNTCYNDWFLPAGNITTPAGQLNCLYTNKAAIGSLGGDYYWSSTEFPGDPYRYAWLQDFRSGVPDPGNKNNTNWVRCVRAFTPETL